MDVRHPPSHQRADVASGLFHVLRGSRDAVREEGLGLRAERHDVEAVSLVKVLQGIGHALLEIGQLLGRDAGRTVDEEDDVLGHGAQAFALEVGGNVDPEDAAAVCPVVDLHGHGQERVQYLDFGDAFACLCNPDGRQVGQACHLGRGDFAGRFLLPLGVLVALGLRLCLGVRLRLHEGRQARRGFAEGHGGAGREVELHPEVDGTPNPGTKLGAGDQAGCAPVRDDLPLRLLAQLAGQHLAFRRELVVVDLQDGRARRLGLPRSHDRGQGRRKHHVFAQACQQQTRLGLRHLEFVLAKDPSDLHLLLADELQQFLICLLVVRPARPGGAHPFSQREDGDPLAGPPEVLGGDFGEGVEV